MNNLEKKKTLRDLYLKRLYEASDGSVLRVISFADLGRDLGWDDETSDKVTAYLKNEGLVDFPAVGKVCITHKGVKHVEKAAGRLRQSGQSRSQPGFVTLMAEGDINVGGDVVGRNKKAKKKSS